MGIHYEAEMKEYLEAKGIPKDEGTYPEELMTQITIQAFEELYQELGQQQEEYEHTIKKYEGIIRHLQDKFDTLECHWLKSTK